MTVEEARRMSVEMFAAAPPGVAVARVEDICVPEAYIPAPDCTGACTPGSGADIPVRVYTPEGEGPYPILVYFHGGGWVLGDLEAQDADCRNIADGAGCVVVSVDYRLAPEHKFPGPAEDAYRGTCWVAENANHIGDVRAAGERALLAVGGTSAGGNLAAVVALMARDRGGPPLACQVLTVPVTDYRFDTDSYRKNGEHYVLTTGEMQWFWKHYLARADDGVDPYASPLRAPDLSLLPPALIQTAEFDPLRDEGRAYAERLSAAGVPVTYRCYDGMIHMMLGPEAASDVAAYLREHLPRP
jgi:acetyl esterase